MNVQEYISEYYQGIVTNGSKETYNTREIIERTERSRAGRFDEPYFSDGETEKYFYNITFGFAQTLWRNAKINLKDFLLTSTNGKYIKLVNMLKMMTRYYLQYSWFDQIRDDATQQLIDHGHVVIKVLDGEVCVVNPLNLVVRPDSRSIQEGGAVERFTYTYQEAKAKYGDTDKWEDFETLWAQLKENGETVFSVVEYWTTDEFDTENGKQEVTKGCIVYLDQTQYVPEDPQLPDEWEPYGEIYRYASPYFKPVKNPKQKKLIGDKERIFPYYEERLVKIPGRYWGMGVYEIADPIQKDFNEKLNIKRRYDQKALRGVLVHKEGPSRTEEDEPVFSQQFLKSLDTGNAVRIKNDESLESLRMNSTTGDTLNMTNELFETLRFLLGITQQSTGETASNKTASFAMIQQQTQQTTYHILKNKMGSLFGRVFQDIVMPQLIEEMGAEDVIGLTGDTEELYELDRYLIEQEVYAEMHAKKIYLPEDMVEEEIDRRSAVLAENPTMRFIEIKDIRGAFKSMLKKLDYLVEFHFNDEIIDKSTQLQVLETLRLQPVQGFSVEKIVDKQLDLVNVNPKTLKLSAREQLEQQRAQQEQLEMLQEARDEEAMKVGQLQQQAFQGEQAVEAEGLQAQRAENVAQGLNNVA